MSSNSSKFFKPGWSDMIDQNVDSKHDITKDYKWIRTSFYTHDHTLVEPKPMMESNFLQTAKNALSNSIYPIENFSNYNDNNFYMPNETIEKEAFKNFLKITQDKEKRKNDKNYEEKKNPLEKNKQFKDAENNWNFKPKLMELQVIPDDQLKNWLANPIDQNNSNLSIFHNIFKADFERKKKEEMNAKKFEKLIKSQNELVASLVLENEKSINNKIKLKYSEINNELDKLELGISNDFYGYNKKIDELRYLLKKTQREDELNALEAYNSQICQTFPQNDQNYYQPSFLEWIYACKPNKFLNKRKRNKK